MLEYIIRILIVYDKCELVYSNLRDFIIFKII